MHCLKFSVLQMIFAGGPRQAVRGYQCKSGDVNSVLQYTRFVLGF